MRKVRKVRVGACVGACARVCMVYGMCEWVCGCVCACARCACMYACHGSYHTHTRTHTHKHTHTHLMVYGALTAQHVQHSGQGVRLVGEEANNYFVSAHLFGVEREGKVCMGVECVCVGG